MNPNSKEFKQIQKEWYGKLKDTGFQDIEKDETYLLKSSFMHVRLQGKHPVPVRDMTAKQKTEAGKLWLSYINQKSEYYRIAEHFLNRHKFAKPLDKFIWKNHSEGVSLRSISKLLKEELNVTLERDAVHAVVKKYSKIMLKEYRESSED